MKRILKVAAALAAAFVLALGLFYAVAMGGKAAIPDGLRLDAVQVVKDGFVSAHLLDIGPGEVALIDSGNDPEAKAVVAALKARGLGPDSVKAVVLTHGDIDHVAGVRQFPKAAVMALEPDIDLAEGRTSRTPFLSPRPTGVRVSRLLEDGEVVELGATRIEVFAVPGHTPGSAAYLARGILFLGDSAEIREDGTLEAARWPFCENRAENRSSLRQLARRLGSRAGEVKAIACSHSGVLTRGLAPLTELAGRLPEDSTP
jgi:glyoxylase-like metal-dependent hydrolase (beta-lactamase superfamily II)